MIILYVWLCVRLTLCKRVYMYVCLCVTLCLAIFTLRSVIFSERDTYVHVRYMLSAVRRSSVCLSSVTLVHPTQPVEVFGNFFHHTIAQGL